MSIMSARRTNPTLRPRSILDPFFQEFFNDDGESWIQPFRSMLQWNERLGSCDFEKTADSYVVSVDVPGLTKEEVSLEIEDGCLKVSGERKPKEKKEGVEYLASERSYRRFDRTFRLPDDVDLDKTDAKVENGVLILTLGRKKAEKAGKTIKIK